MSIVDSIFRYLTRITVVSTVWRKRVVLRCLDKERDITANTSDLCLSNLFLSFHALMIFLAQFDITCRQGRVRAREGILRARFQFQRYFDSESSSRAHFSMMNSELLYFERTFLKVNFIVACYVWAKRDYRVESVFNLRLTLISWLDKITLCVHDKTSIWRMRSQFCE